VEMQGSPRYVPVRLAAMMFLQYAGLAAWVVPLSGWLRKSAEEGGLGFNPMQLTLIYVTIALGGLIAPFLTGLLADRFFSSEKLISVMHVLLACLMAICGRLVDRYSGANANPGEACPRLFAVLFAYSTACIIAITVGNAMAMRTLANPHRTFGFVRLVGTLGWIVSCAALEAFLLPHSSDLFDLAAGCHLALGIYARWLPHTPPKGRGRPIREVMGLPAAKLFRDPSFIVFAIVAFVCQMMQQFYTVYAYPYAMDLGMPRPGTLLGLAQVVEMGCMASMPFLIARIGLKATMSLGLVAWVFRNAVLAMGHLPTVVGIALPLHGISYTLFTIVAALYIDREAPPHLRAGAQALLTFVSGGPGTLLGFFLSGQIVATYTVGTRTDWTAVWIVPFIGCSLAMALFIWLFHEPKSPQPDMGAQTPALRPENP
jgi:nucleoside transporter